MIPLNETLLNTQNNETRILGLTSTFLEEAILDGQITSLVEARMIFELVGREQETGIIDQKELLAYQTASYGNKGARIAVCNIEHRKASESFQIKSIQDRKRQMWITLGKYIALDADPFLNKSPLKRSQFDSQYRTTATNEFGDKSAYRGYRTILEKNDLSLLSENSLRNFLRSEFYFYSFIIDQDHSISNSDKTKKFMAAIRNYNQVSINGGSLRPLNIDENDPYLLAVRAYYAFTGNQDSLKIYCQEEYLRIMKKIQNPTSESDIRENINRSNRWKFIIPWVHNGYSVAKQDQNGMDAMLKAVQNGQFGKNG